MSIPTYSVFVISHNRTECKTYNWLMNNGFNRDLFIVIDTEDKSIDEYRKLYGDRVLVFDKGDYDCDLFDNNPSRTSATFARNACFDFAKERGSEYLIIFDDDISGANYRFMVNGKLKSQKVTNVTAILDEIVKWVSCANNFGCASYNLATNFRGVFDSLKKDPVSMFVVSSNDELRFRGRASEDINFAYHMGLNGKFTLSINNILLNIPAFGNESQAGGYRDQTYGGYRRDWIVRFRKFITPVSDGIIHWANMFPKLLSYRYKK